MIAPSRMDVSGSESRIYDTFLMTFVLYTYSRGYLTNWNTLIVVKYILNGDSKLLFSLHIEFGHNETE